MNIILSNTSEMLITGTNEKLDSFYIRPKSDFELELSRKDGNKYDKIYTVISSIEGCYSEVDIIYMMKDTKFYTYFNKSFTDVTVVDNHLRSISNDTKMDNLQSLPKNVCK